MDRKNYIEQLVTFLVERMLPSMAVRDGKAVKCFVKAHIAISENPLIPVEFELYKFFDAVVFWGQASGIEVPVNMDYQKYFNEFCKQIMNPWPIEAFERVSLKIKLTHKSNAKTRYKYQISNT